MLSMKSSVSPIPLSQKYSAIVIADKPTRNLAPGGSFICPKTRQVWASTVSCCIADVRPLHFQPQVVALACAFADAGEYRIPAVLCRDSGDKLLYDDGLADARPAEQARLAAADKRAKQIDDLDTRLEHLGLGRNID